MKCYDISREFFAAPLYPGTPAPKVVRMMDMAAGDAYNLGFLQADLHTSTHADACMHFIDGGADIAQMPLERYVGPCRVLTVPRDAPVTEAFLKARVPAGTRRLLIRGGGNAPLTPEAARYLVSMGVETVGTDGVSVGPPDGEAAVHAPLLSAGVAIIEQLDLSAVADGAYMLIAPPIRIAGAEAAPCRAILIEM